jgi:Tol biopolymer transport system component
MQAWTIGADGSGLTQVTDEKPGAAFPAWSPDGKRLAVVHTGGLGSPTILIALSNPKAVERTIPAIEGRTFAPFSWSRDGRVLAGSTFSFVPRQAVFLYSMADSQMREVAAGRAPLWMSDGRRLIFQTIEGGIGMVDARSGRTKQIAPDGTLRTLGGGLEASLSADDRKIAYVDTHREGDVWLMHLGGAAPAGTPAPPP